MINGICIVSFYSTNQLNLEDMKAIMGEIMNIVGENILETTGKQRSSVAGGSDDFRNFLGYLEETGGL